MKPKKKPIASAALLLFICAAPLFSLHAQDGGWVGTWAASPLPADNPSGTFGVPGGRGTTLRQIVHVSLGGASVRIRLTNEFGTAQLTVGAAELALTGDKSSIVSGSGKPLTFGGKSSVIIPPGAFVVSDPVALNVAPLSNLTISLYIPDQQVKQLTFHPLANQTGYIAAGNIVDSVTLPNATEIHTWDFIKGVDVTARSTGAAIVTLGDSITDGAHTTANANTRWPDVLARRLQANKKTDHLSVLNEGISGNRLLHDNAGPDSLARFDRDVLAQQGVRYLIVLEGINDIGRTTMPRVPDDPITTDQLLFSLNQIIDRAHAHGIKVIGATLTPYEGAAYASASGEKMREAENDFIRNSGRFDGVIDFDKLTRDPAHPTAFLLANDCGDHLHPNDAGYKAMGEGIDLKLFEK